MKTAKFLVEPTSTDPRAMFRQAGVKNPRQLTNALWSCDLNEMQRADLYLRGCELHRVIDPNPAPQPAENTFWQLFDAPQ